MNDWILKKVVSEKTDSGVSYFRAVYNNGINELDEFFEHGYKIPTKIEHKHFGKPYIYKDKIESYES
jgi:hypothetical protein